MLYLTCITITSVDLAHYGVSRAKDWVSVDCGTNSTEMVCNRARFYRMALSFFFIVHVSLPVREINCRY